MRKLQREAAQVLSVWDRATAAILALGMVAVAVVYRTSNLDPFREPKETVLRLTAILAVVGAVFFATARGRKFSDLWSNISHRDLVLCGAVIAWTIVTTLTSTNHLLSISSIVTVLTSVALYLTGRRLVPSFSLRALDVCLIPAILNATVIILQEAHVWNPFSFALKGLGHEEATAFVGHPNEVGTYFLAPAVAATVGVIVVRGKRRLVYILIAVLLVSGIVASATRTALIAFAVSLLALALHRPWKQSLMIGAALVVVVASIFAGSKMMRHRFGSLVDAARARRYDKLTSERLVPFLTAIDMFRKHPVVGVGPGCFRYHYMDERLEVINTLPENLTRSWPQNFGETHNDHLQVAAETGLPGYLLFVAALVLLAAPALRKRNDGARIQAAYARALALPLATAFAVVTLAQFPLQIASARLMFLSFAALVRGWSSGDV